MTKAAVAVVLPYFQRERGILCRALQSVFMQEDAPSAQVYVVDDGSPVPAAIDLDTLHPSQRRQITLLRQPNRGPGSARNAGLAAIPADVSWVAFLDSDDIWHPQHLARAVSALQKGYDFFFANAQREGSSVTTFDASRFDRSGSPLIDPERALFEFRGELFKSVLTYTPIGTPTVVFRRSRFGEMRFIESIRTCEDLMFWLDVAKTRRPVAFGADVQVTYGKGLNIYDSLVWNSNEALQECINWSLFLAEIKRRFRLEAEERALVRRKAVENQETFVRALSSMLRHRKSVDLSTCAKFVRMNPALLAHFVRVATTEVKVRIKNAVST